MMSGAWSIGSGRGTALFRGWLRGLFNLGESSVVESVQRFLKIFWCLSPPASPTADPDDAYGCDDPANRDED